MCSFVFIGNKGNGKMIMNCEQITIWNETVVVCFKIRFWHLPGETDENHDKLEV
jgi:hypothetical protein